MNKKECVEKILKRQDPGRIVYSPNYWQWFTHQKTHNLLTPEISHCHSQLDLIRHLGLDVFSRNIYSDYFSYWWGGLAKVSYDGVEVEESSVKNGEDTFTTKTVRTGKGTLTEKLHYVFSESTLVQEKFLVDDYQNQLEALEAFIFARSWTFDRERYIKEQAIIGDDGFLIAGEFYSPLKLLHVLLGPVNTTYLISDHPEFTKRICDHHEKVQLDLLKQMVSNGVPSVMAMDNLDTFFHPPTHVDEFSASFYGKASQICHQHGSTFFIHACGRQKDNLKRICSLGVDGLEGIVHPPIGDITLKEAFEMTDDNFILTGGISAKAFDELKTREQVDAYCKQLFEGLQPYRNRFVFASSCTTPFTADYEQLLYFRDAWEKYGQ